MSFEGPDQLHLRAAAGYIELEMFEEANAELEVDPILTPGAARKKLAETTRSLPNSRSLMQVRKLSARIGAVVRTVDAYPYTLPKGLPSGVEVTVVRYDLKTHNYVVRDALGQEWIIKALQNLDAGSEYMLGGRWLPEDHPLVLAELRRTRTNS